ncbi:MAG: malonic semialdehyde reductase, partial [Caulobacteraceae bacterium]|nr:malonic semialdehyde reductase [Caulobacter sp.]
MADLAQAEPPVAAPTDAQVLDRLFHSARSRNAWREESLPPETWRDLYDLVKQGPTSANISPARFVFVTSEEGKRRLQPHLSEGNQKALKAPCIAILGYDMDFPEHMPRLFPHNPDAKGWFADPVGREQAAFRNSSLQGGYMIIAARALGLDCGPMSGFDAAGVDAEFWAGTAVKTNFLCALGHGADTPFPRS